MKKSDIFVAVISEPTFLKAMPVLGKPLGNYLEDEIAVFPHARFECEKRIIRPNCKYFCVLYDDMALVTAADLIEATVMLENQNVGKIRLGDGYMERVGGNLEAKYIPYAANFLRANDTSSINLVYNEIKKRKNMALLASGVLLLGDVAVDVTAKIESGVTLCGNVQILGNSLIRSGAKIVDSVVDGSEIGQNTTVGPFANVRAGSKIGKNCRIGDYVEIKASLLGDGVKVAHLSYVGNATLGDGVNVGCGTVFCNYDGIKKHHTTVGKNVFIGANANLVAPLKIGDGSFIAAGSTITEDIPDEAFCVARSPQKVKPRRR